MKVHFPPKLRCLFKPSRYKVLYGGRGGSKSWGVARALLLQGVEQPLRILCAREFQNSIKDSVHRLLADQIDAMGLAAFYDVLSNSIVGANGTEFAFEGLRHNVNSIKSYEGVDRAWVEEGHAVSKASWNVLIPTIRKDGSEIWVTFNPEFEDDDTFVRFVTDPPKSALIQEINWRDNPWFPRVLEEERLELKRKDPGAYDHVWEGKCRQWLEGAIYANELRDVYESGRVTRVEFDPALPVYTAWDLGRTDDTAIWWFQVMRGEIHVLESYAASGGNLDDHASQILGRKVTIDLIGDRIVAEIGGPIAELSHRLAYKYAMHMLPHDARAKTLAAKGKPIIAQLAAALGWDKLDIAPDLSVEDGITAARLTLKRSWFDKDGTADGLKALRRYQRKLLPDEKSLQRKPSHDWTSHYADAFRMLAVSWENVTVPVNKPTAQEVIAKAAQHVPTFAEIEKWNDERRGGRARV